MSGSQFHFPKKSFTKISYSSPGTYNFTIPEGINLVYVKMCGAGQGGDFGTGSSTGGGGIGGDIYEGWVNIASNTLTAIVGTGGTGAIELVQGKGAGGNTSFSDGTTTIFASGGGNTARTSTVEGAAPGGNTCYANGGSGAGGGGASLGNGANTGVNAISTRPLRGAGGGGGFGDDGAGPSPTGTVNGGPGAHGYFELLYYNPF